MIRTNRPNLLIAALVGALALTPLADAAPVLKILHAWSQPTPPGASTAVGYLTIVNPGRSPDRLLQLDSPAANSVSVHLMSMAGGIMRMRPVQGGLAVPASGKVVLAPDGYHLMFVGLKRPFMAGDHIPLTLIFQKAGAVRSELEVEAPAGGMPGMDMPGMDMSGTHSRRH